MLNSAEETVLELARVLGTMQLIRLNVLSDVRIYNELVDAERSQRRRAPI